MPYLLSCSMCSPRCASIRNTTAGPVYDRLSLEAMKIREENERRRLALLEEEQLQCTFTPQLSRAFNRSAGSASKEAATGGDVFDRLAGDKTPTAAWKNRRNGGGVGSAGATPDKRPIPVVTGTKKSKIPVPTSPTLERKYVGNGQGGEGGGSVSLGTNKGLSDTAAVGEPTDAELATGLAQAMADMVGGQGGNTSGGTSDVVRDKTEVDDGADNDCPLQVKTENISL